MGGRRRHILEEFVYIKGLAAKKATILVIGAGFIGVEWATELQYFFPDLNITVIDMLPRIARSTWMITVSRHSTGSLLGWEAARQKKARRPSRRRSSGTTLSSQTARTSFTSAPASRRRTTSCPLRPRASPALAAAGGFS